MATILPYPETLELIKFVAEAQSITAHVRPKARASCCPCCGHRSTRIHSRYQRILLDLPWQGVPLRLHLQVRRFFCDVVACAQQIFAERLPDVVAPYAHRTQRVDVWFTVVGLALGGEAGARLLQTLGVSSSPDTLLRQISALPFPSSAPGTAVGIDEFSFRRGRRFGTIIVDLASHRVLDLLPDVTKERVVAWLQQHPQIHIVSRDRAYNFGEAIRQGAPQAQQIADRFHLLQNLGDRIEAVLRNHKAALTTPRGELLASQGIALGRTPDQEHRSIEWHQRRRDWYEQVHAAQAHGLNDTAIAKLVGISRPTVAKYLAMTTPPERVRLPSRALRPNAAYVPYLYQRWNEGCRNGSQIYRELVEQGISTTLRTVIRYMTILRRENSADSSFASVEPTARYSAEAPPTPSLTVRQGSRLFAKAPERLTDQERDHLCRIFARDDELAPLYEVVQAFGTMVRTRGGKNLDTWLNQAEHSGCSQLVAFAAGLRKDLSAVRAGLTEPYSQGVVEGHVHRVKLIKRSGYGRMSFPLLRQRVLASQTG